ncbi:hypothetical protein RA2_02066 [Roseovarius sp. A-2]|uniref:hypothetical protein n=1 Tax=Roseovarius sp. A-2 TaxID=1570360 RepID=UPI0009B51E20|nr:hypothetical protein [Roseovarius sp. A-2]GAW35008.1 hypothetical protein RA2_02066 [Roseovarius sp. A-2]
MRDDSEKWDVPQPIDCVHKANGITLAPATLSRQVLFSGPSVLAQTEQPIASWPDIVAAHSYALSIRRDRVLQVNGPAASEGWHGDTCQAVTDASDAYAVFDISGERSLEVLKRGAELSLDVPSKSVARILFNLGVFLYRYEAETKFRIHVASGHAEALVRSLKVAIAAS